MAVVKNKQFSILVKIDGRVREFNFRKRSETSYDADVNDDRSGRCQFQWNNSQEGWRVNGNIDSLPTWLVNNSSSIREVFLTELL